MYRVTRTVALFALLTFLTSAEARAVSDDLLFCSKLAEKTERVACYNAAARIAERVPQRVIPVAKAIQPTKTHVGDVSLSVGSAKTKTEFDGFYVAALGGYTLRTTGTPSIFTNAGYSYPSYLPNYQTFPLATLDDVTGGNVGGAFGFNVTNGRLLIGAEFRGRYDFAQSSEARSYYYNQLPAVVSSGCCCPSCSSPNPIMVTLGSTTYIDEYRRPANLDLSMRVGFIIDDWLMFGRFGIGVEMVEHRSVTNNTRQLACSTTPVRTSSGGGSYTDTAVSCGSVSAVQSYDSVYRSAAPFGTVGIGLERNFGPFFARVEGEFAGHTVPRADGFINPVSFLGTTPTGNNWYYTVQASGAIGVRF